MADDEKQTLEINWVQAMAGALAAVSSAVLLSTVGVAGTIIGAAIGSVVATLGSAVYSHYLHVTRQRIAKAQAAAFARVARAQASVSGAGADVDNETTRAEQELAQAERELREAQRELAVAEDAPASVGWREALSGLPWKRITAVAAALFVVAMLVILAFELLTGRAVSTYTGGSDDDTRTSIPGMADSGRERPREETPDEPVQEPTGTSEATPTSEPTPTETLTPPQPTEAPSETAIVTPTVTPTPEPTPTTGETSP